ncbi:hypothetical protein A0H81_02060 [Grifola frondosa]|uniref:Uncharacterized protein n=1 Tax=Grifola frondosa TaxID=5627 RepID=A0A1C7MKW1_GRIFR|nr:hypothetical protein A0H81_02060 [Grifola frondosa]
MDDNSSFESLPTLDQLLRPKHNARSARSKRTSNLVFANANYSPTESVVSGLLTPPLSQTREDVNAAKMFISPPPEETLRASDRSSVARLKPTPASNTQPPFTPSLLADSVRASASASASKRKRAGPSFSSSRALPEHTFDDASTVSRNAAAETTPNPKPRKQSKRHISVSSRDSPTYPKSLESPASEPTTPTKSNYQRGSISPTKRALLCSPHAANPDADFIPPLPILNRETLSSRCHSATPIPRYEPPPSALRHLGRFFAKVKKKLVLTIKKEPPDIDLTLPPPPGSPTDDPLLLSAPPKRTKSRRSHAATYSRHTPVLPSSSPIRTDDMDGTRLLDLPLDLQYKMQMATADFTSDDAPAPPMFHFDTDMQDVDGGWDDDDDDDDDDLFNQSGEYTGKFTLLTVPTKADPPSSCTKQRMDAWGHPISPFPRIDARRSLSGSPTPGADQTEERDDASLPGPHHASAVAADALQKPTCQPAQNAKEVDEGDAFIEEPERAPTIEIAAESSSDKIEMEGVIETTSDDLKATAIASPPRTHHPSAVAADVLQKPTYQPAQNTKEVNEGDAFMEEPEWAPTIEIAAESSSDEIEVEERVIKVTSDDPRAAVIASPPSPQKPTCQLAQNTKEVDEGDTLMEELGRAPTIEIDAESSSDEIEMDENVIKITSDDPWAAARAAAILKMHDYDCIPHILSPKRRHSHTTIDALMRNTRRKSTSDSGVGKRASPARRRRTLGGVIGDKVFIPGSPMMTLPQLLKEAEVNLEHGEGKHIHTPLKNTFGKDAFKTPLTKPQFETTTSSTPGSSSIASLEPRSWVKDDWKLLDACFTDERLLRGASAGTWYDTLGSVDDVALEHVVDRFLEHMRWIPTRYEWSGWSRGSGAESSCIAEETTFGNGAPPTPSGVCPHRFSSMQPTLDHSKQLPDTALGKSHVPASLLAPRYSHLLQEAIAISKEEAGPPVYAPQAEVHPEPEPEMAVKPPALPPATVSEPVQETPSRSIATRVKGFPDSPPEVFKKPRLPISTPASKPIMKPTHPKDLVQLHHAPPPKPSMIPRVAQKPKPLVKLRPAPSAPPVRPKTSLGILSDRRSSAGSVKDLVKGFEDMEKQQALEKKSYDMLHLRRTKSIGEWVSRDKWTEVAETDLETMISFVHLMPEI